MNKICTSIEQSKKFIELGLDVKTADMFWDTLFAKKPEAHVDNHHLIDEYDDEHRIPAWSLTALLKLIPKRILRKDKIHYGQAYIPSFRWEITPTTIYYTDGNNIMDYVSFGYGKNNIELIDAVFKMVVWLKENGKI